MKESEQTDGGYSIIEESIPEAERELDSSRYIVNSDGSLNGRVIGREAVPGTKPLETRWDLTRWPNSAISKDAQPSVRWSPYPQSATVSYVDARSVFLREVFR